MTNYVHCSSNEGHYRPKRDIDGTHLVSVSRFCVENDLYSYDRCEYEPTDDGTWRTSATTKRVKSANLITSDTRLTMSFYDTFQKKKEKTKTLYVGIPSDLDWRLGVVGSDNSQNDNRIPCSNPLVTCFNNPTVKNLRKNFNPETSNIVELYLNVKWHRMCDYNSIVGNPIYDWLIKKQRCQTFARLRPPPINIKELIDYIIVP